MNLTSSQKKHRLYSDLSWTWPIISPPEDYIEETEYFYSAIREHSRLEVKTLLNVFPLCSWIFQFLPAILSLFSIRVIMRREITSLLILLIIKAIIRITSTFIPWAKAQDINASGMPNIISAFKLNIHLFYCPAGTMGHNSNLALG